MMKPRIQKAKSTKKESGATPDFYPTTPSPFQKIPWIGRLFTDAPKFSGAPKRINPLIWWFCCWILGILISLEFSIPSFTLLFPLGLMVAFLGFGLWSASFWSFYRNQNDIRPFRKTKTLLENGVFSISRHPFYLASALMLFGFFLAFRPPFGLLSLVPYLIYIDRFMRHEETQLRLEFGRRYELYQARVGRWF